MIIPIIIATKIITAMLFVMTVTAVGGSYIDFVMICFIMPLSTTVSQLVIMHDKAGLLQSEIDTQMGRLKSYLRDAKNMEDS